MKKIISLILSFFILSCSFCLVSFAADDLYLGDHEELITSFSGLEDKLGLNTAHSGDDICIGDYEYDKGLGLHCNPQGTDTYIEIDISGQDYEYFSAYVGVQSVSADNTFLDWGSVKFQVYCDGTLAAETGVCKYQDEPVLITCSVKGVKTLRLVEDCVDGHSCDWGVWGDAKLTNTESEPIETPVPAEPTFDPDHTDEITPEHITGDDFVYISDMYWIDSVSYGTNIVMRDANTNDEWIFDSNNNVFNKGIGMHASSSDYTTFAEVNIAGMGFKTFASYYGICDTLSSYDISMASVKFAVFGDGNLLFESDAMTFGEPFQYMECDITNVSTLKIAIAGAESIAGAWGTWGGAVLIREGDGHTILDDGGLVTDDVTESPEETPAVTEAPTATTDPADATEEPAKASGCGSAVLGLAPVILAACAVLVLGKERRDEK